jgi:hypothetical protein
MMTLQGIQTSLLSEVEPYWLANPGAVQCDRSDLTLDQPLDPIAELQLQRQQLQQSDLAPATAWLEKAKCHNRECYQWYWRSDKPIFNGKKRCYVGMDGSAAVAAAQRAIERRKELEQVERKLKKLESTHADAT